MYVGLAPEWVLLKAVDGVRDWRIVDKARGDEIALSANSTAAESSEGVTLGVDGLRLALLGLVRK